MISILIIEDDASKAEKVSKAILESPEIKESDISIASDLIQARDLCRKNLYDLLILDLHLPNRIGDIPQSTAGSEFIKELNTSITLLRPFHIIGLTAHEDAFKESDPIFEYDLWRIIKYDPQTNSWYKQLTTKLQYLIESKKALLESQQYMYDLGIVTALHLPEYQSILDLQGEWVEVRTPNDSTIYHKGFFQKGDKKVSVIAACAQQMGVAAAAVLSAKLISQFRPRFLAMTGIAATVKDSDISLGDTLVADQSWDYESGKHKTIQDNPIFEPDPKCIPLDVGLKSKFQNIKTNNSFLDDIQRKWRGTMPKTRLQIHIGPVASGSAVIQNELIVQHIKSQNRKLIGLDMETYGVFFAAENCTYPKPKAFSIKSACDFADAKKSDDYQFYAAYTSAQSMS